MSTPPRDRLKELFGERALSFGDFTLASGKKSSYYVNSKQALFHSETTALLAEMLWEQTRDLDVQAIGGLEVGAIPMTAAAVMRYHQEGREMEGFFVRKEAKSHGSKQLVEGRLEAGWKVAIVDDVLTTGGSAMQAVTAVENAGAEVVAIVCIVDRLQGAEELFAGKYQYRPIFTIRDFGIEPPSEGSRMKT